MYSVYVWGSSLIITIIICITLYHFEFILNTSNLVRPEVGMIKSWFDKNMANMCYWTPVTICSIISLCLFISMAKKIRRYKEDNHLINFDNWGYENEDINCAELNHLCIDMFNLSQKRLILMYIVIGISCFIGIGSIFFSSTNTWYTMYISYLIDIVQNLGIFNIYVCKKRIKNLLLKRFGCQNYNVPPTARQTEVVQTRILAPLRQE